MYLKFISCKLGILAQCFSIYHNLAHYFDFLLHVDKLCVLVDKQHYSLYIAFHMLLYVHHNL